MKHSRLAQGNIFKSKTVERKTSEPAISSCRQRQQSKQQIHKQISSCQAARKMLFNNNMFKFSSNKTDVVQHQHVRQKIQAKTHFWLTNNTKQAASYNSLPTATVRHCDHDRQTTCKVKKKNIKNLKGKMTQRATTSEMAYRIQLQEANIKRI